MHHLRASKHSPGMLRAPVLPVGVWRQKIILHLQPLSGPAQGQWGHMGRGSGAHGWGRKLGLVEAGVRASGKTGDEDKG